MRYQSNLHSSSILWTYGHAACAALRNLGCVLVSTAQQRCSKVCSLESGIEQASDATDWIMITRVVFIEEFVV